MYLYAWLPVLRIAGARARGTNGDKNICAAESGLVFREGTFQPVTALPDQAKISVYLCPQDTKTQLPPEENV